MLCDWVTYSSATRSKRCNARAWSLDVKNAAVVGVKGLSVVGLGGTDSANAGLRSRRLVLCVLEAVTSGGSNKDALLDERSNGVVHGLHLEASSQRQVDNNTLGTVSLSRILGNCIDGSNDTRVRSGSVAGKDLESVDGGLFGHAVRLAANCTSRVCSVAVVVPIGSLDPRAKLLGTALKVGVVAVDTSVNGVSADAFASTVVVAVGAATRSSAGDASKTPDGVVLSDPAVDGRNTILLNVLDLRYVSLLFAFVLATSLV